MKQVEELHNHPDAFDYLTPGEQKHLTSWIETNLKPTKTFNDRRTSYGLKHCLKTLVASI